MSNEILYALGGFMTGAITGSVAKTSARAFSECMSVPLYDRNIVSQVPTMDNYLELTTFPNSTSGIENHDFWHGCIFKDALGNYHQIASFHMYGQYHRAWYKNHTTGEYVEQKITDIFSIQWEYIDDLIKITSPLGVVVINTTTNSSTVDINISGHFISLVFTGKPVFYNDRNTLIIVPDTFYLKGFEVVGNSFGTLDGVNVSGFGNLERCNWNWRAPWIPGEKWIGFTIGNGETCGVIYKQGLMHDSGIYINGVYKKPVLFNVNTVTYQYSNGKIYPLNQEIHVQLDDGLLIIIMTWRGKHGDENICDVSAYFNGFLLGNGLAWVEISGVI